MEKIKVVGALPYDRVRKDCHAIKDGNNQVIHHYGWQIAKFLNPGFEFGTIILVPIPGHTGIANQTLKLSEVISSFLNVRGFFAAVSDVLMCDRHEPLYDIKKRGEDISKIPLGIRYKSKRHKQELAYWLSRLGTIEQHPEYRLPNLKIYLVDNVVDTGYTVREVFKVTSNLPVIAVGDSGLHMVE